MSSPSSSGTPLCLEGSTVVLFGNTHFTWRIGNFLEQVQFANAAGKIAINSSPFLVTAIGAKVGKKFKLTVQWKRPEGNKGLKDSDYIGLYLSKERGSDSAVATFELYALKPSGEKWKDGTPGTPRYFSSSAHGWGHGAFCSKENLLKDSVLSEDGTLTVVCQVKCLLEKEDANDDDVITCMPLVPPTLTLGQQLHIDRESRDVTIVVEHHKEFHLHKNVLTSRSKVFAAMFSYSSTLESRTSRIILPDVTSEIMTNFEHFLYLDDFPGGLSLEHLSPLLALAEKYNIDGMKKVAERRICRLINTENAPRILALGVLHNAGEIQQHLRNFQARRRKRVWWHLRFLKATRHLLCF